MLRAETVGVDHEARPTSEKSVDHVGMFGEHRHYHAGNLHAADARLERHAPGYLSDATNNCLRRPVVTHPPPP